MEILDGVESGSKYYLSIKLGDNELYPGTWELLKTSFQGKTLVGGGVSEKAAKQIALQVRTGGLKYDYEISEPVTISSTYGPNVDTRALIAVCAFVVVIMAALIVLYRGLGVVGSLSMLLFILLETLMLIAVPNIVLSLGGVLGIMVSTIVTALGVAYTLSSIKREFATTEKTVVAAVKKGFKDTLMPIIGAGVVSGALALSLLAFCTGLAKGFAITFGIGVVVGLLSTLLFTRMFTALILPLAENKEKLLNLKREDA
jgi:preprotein translocase subunit SecD